MNLATQLEAAEGQLRAARRDIATLERQLGEARNARRRARQEAEDLREQLAYAIASEALAAATAAMWKRRAGHG